ncbi:hypothetical protein SEA_OCTOBIEN14_69 [Gordonia phage Octobien14]|uniref:Uncharacterized protein n=1 Tax=Gordonia phage Octobien14 TaxID=2483673 RepID=A0A3G3M9Y0_9CAUD|nr:hypothetical protein L3Y22_gp069 [Gordonia phage Octobien14]AYR03215.1 hypothetical protein SEA_OCTOBIEN14_69 [Gordonia phage Octobien14]
MSTGVGHLMNNERLEVLKRTAKWIVGVVAGLLLLLALAGCSGGTEYEGPDDYTAKIVELRDGRELTCIVFGMGQDQMMSCDWENAK